MSSQIQVTPDCALVDEKVKIELLNFPMYQPVKISATWQDSSGTVFASHATFETDGRGYVDVSSQQPIAGTYDTADPMGLFWSMQAQGEADRIDMRAPDPLMPWQVDLAATVNDVLVASTHLKRLWILPEITRQPMRDQGLVGVFFCPAGVGPFPALLVLGGSNGSHLEPLAAMPASHGYATLALAYFGVESLPKDMAEIPLEYFKRGIDWLRSHELVAQDKLGVIGISRGGELALLLAATFPEIRAVISYVGSGYTHSHRARTTTGDKHLSTWTYQGRPFPFYRGDNDDASADAIIPVERICGPVLLISGKEDRMWPSYQYSEVARSRLEAHAHPFHFEHLSYEGAGHLIKLPYTPTTVLGAPHPVSGKFHAFGGNPKDTAFASMDAWQHVLAFLKQSLGHDAM